MKVSLGLLFRVLGIWVLAAHCHLSSALAAPSDLNADGLSDIVLIEIKSDGALSWHAYSPSSLSPLFLAFQQGRVGDHIAPANWLASGSAQLAYLSASGSAVRWNVSSGAGQTKSFRFGHKSDLLLAGADFNADGYTDAAFVRTSDSGLVWTIKYDPLAPASVKRRSVSRRSLRFGKGSDLIFYASPKGKADWLALLRARQAGGSQLIMRNPANGRTKRIILAAHKFSDLRPLPLKQPTGQNILALIERSSGTTKFTFVGLAHGQILGSREMSGSGELLVGNFSASAEMPGEEIAIQTSSGFSVLNPFSQALIDLALPSGVAVDQVNINSFGSSGGGGGQTCKNETRNPIDGGDGFLWKPVSDSTGKLAVLMPASISSQIVNVVIKSPAGALIETGAYGGIGNGNRYHARFSKPGGQYPDGTIAVANLKGGCAISYPISDTSRRVD